MVQPQYGQEMDRPSEAGSVRRARERAQAGASRGNSARPFQQSSTKTQELQDMPINSSPRRYAGGAATGPSRIPRPQGQGLQGKDGEITVPISRPTQIPQWPLSGPMTAPANPAGSEPYRPPHGRSQPPQRPPRPSQVPSILDGSRIQDHTPVFQYTPHEGRDSIQSQDLASPVPPTPSSRKTQSTISSVGSIPDFPMPTAPGPTLAAPVPSLAPPRRSVNLGPPPSARRGASSFYSNASFVSPIPEESPRSRSHGSFASSSAMPESWDRASPQSSPGASGGAYYEDIISEEDSLKSQSHFDEDGDESKLVRSASIGKRGKPAIVMNRGGAGTAEPSRNLTAVPEPTARPSPTPMQPHPQDPFQGGASYLDVSSSSSGALPTRKTTGDSSPPTADAMLGALAAASASDPVNIRKATPSPRPFSRLSAIRRPPKLGLDMDSVRAMEARGSMTSLPDLIKRATRLAAMMDRGKRPASRFEDLSDWPDEKERDLSEERHQSGLSDMLAAFPPPAGTPAPTGQSRGSWFRKSTSSWPLAPSGGQTPQAQARARGKEDAGSEESGGKKRRRCCGLPVWAFVLIILVIFIIVAAAIAVPLYFFVFRDNNQAGSRAEPALAECQARLGCENGGTNVIARGVCSCICTNGFTGSTCAVSGATGCTTTSLVLMADEGNISNVTLGQAIPRLIQQAQTNFTVPLVGTTILAKFNQESLSCIAQNSLVTFDGRSTRTGEGNAEVVMDDDDGSSDRLLTDVAVAPVPVITVAPPPVVTTTIITGTTTVTTTVMSLPTTPPGTPDASGTATSSVAPPTATFTVTEEVLDFARVAVLFVLQERDIQTATASQTSLQRFFAEASDGSRGRNAEEGVTQERATRVRLVNGISVDLVNFLIDMTSSDTDSRTSKRWVELVRDHSRGRSRRRLIIPRPLADTGR